MQFTTLGTVTSADGVQRTQGGPYGHRTDESDRRRQLPASCGTVTMPTANWSSPNWPSSRRPAAGLSGCSANTPRNTKTASSWAHPARSSADWPRRRRASPCPPRPKTGTPSYVQAYAPKVDFLDCGTVFQKNQEVCVPTGCYDDVLVIDEYNPLEPPEAGHQRKFYSAGTGLIKVTAVGGPDQEFMDLVKVRKLNAAQFAAGQRASAGTGRTGLRGQPEGLCQDAASGTQLTERRANCLAGMKPAQEEGGRHPCRPPSLLSGLRQGLA